MKKLDETNVKLVKIQESDLEEFYRIAKEREVEKFVKICYPEDFEEAKIILEMFTEDTNYIALKIQNDNNEFVGIIIGEEKSREIIEISYFIGKEFRGHGYCTLAVKEFRKILKDRGYKEVQFAIASNNKNSQKDMKRLKIPMSYVSRYQIYVDKL